VGIAIVGQSGNLTPADKKLYALRDVTATVESIPLIAASIMSKKIASGARAIVLDVKTGDGAFMKTYEDAEALAKAMVDIGTQVGRETVAIISDMNQPLGYAVGNANEVQEAIETLQGRGPEDLMTLSLTIGAWMLTLAGKVPNAEAGIAYLRAQIENGQAKRKFAEWVTEQHGDARVLTNRALFPSASQRKAIVAKQAGYVTAIAAEAIGHAAMILGAGRATKSDSIDLGVGIQLVKKVGDRVEIGDELAVCQWNTSEGSRVREACDEVESAYQIGETRVAPHPLIYAIIDAQGVHPYTRA
jgi:pyrimidine-nucleoside phosphorylase